MEQIALHINRTVFQRASLYAKEQGVDLSAVIESFLMKWASKPSLDEKIKNFPISKEVKSLTEHLHIDGNAMDWDKEREHYLADKYGFII